MIRRSSLLATIVVPLVLSGCCAPDRCYVAQSRFDKLDPVIGQITRFEASNGRLPDSLEEAFPDGLPEGIEAVPGEEGQYRFAGQGDNFPTFSYGRSGWLGGPAEEITLHFSYVGGGLIAGMNDCFWTESERNWLCVGYL